MGLTALISTILGMLGGVLPDVMKEIRDTRNHDRELEHMERQAELQLKVAQVAADSRLREVESNAFVSEAAAFREQLKALIEAQARPTGIIWIDGFNALLRPVCVTLIMALFMATALPFVWAVLAQFRDGTIDAEMMARVEGSSCDNDLCITNRASSVARRRSCARGATRLGHRAR